MTYRQVFKQKEEADELLLKARSIYRFIGMLETVVDKGELDVDLDTFYTVAYNHESKKDGHHNVSKDAFAVLHALENMTDCMWDEEIPNK